MYYFERSAIEIASILLTFFYFSTEYCIFHPFFVRELKSYLD